MHLKSLGNLINAINEGKQLGSMLTVSANASKVLESSLKDLSAVQILAKTSSLKLSEAQKIELIQLYATDNANYENITSTATLSATQKEATTSTLGLGTAFKGLGASIKSFVMANPALTFAALATAYKKHSIKY